MKETMERVFVLRTAENAAALYSHLKNNWIACAENKTPLYVTVKTDKGKRSREQNKRYWAIIQNISQNAWVNGKTYSVDCWHEHYKRKFIGLVDLPSGGTVGESTTKLTISEFSEYMDKVAADAHVEYGVEP